MKVSNFIDLHVHIGPETIPRKYTVQSLIKEESGKIAGMALKNHFFPTTPLINSVQDRKKLLLVGSVVLNNSVGGLNPEIILATAQLSDLPIVVWFPTISANSFLMESDYEIPLEWTNGKFKSRLSGQVKGITLLKEDTITSDAKKVLNTINQCNAILATGHVSWQEASKLVEEASTLGIKRIIVTHPIYQKIAMPIEMQQKLALLEGVYIEQNYAMYKVDKIPISNIAEQIKSIGAAKCILVSDMGQINNPSPSEGLQEFSELLLKEGITVEELRIMGEVNPRKLLGLK